MNKVVIVGAGVAGLTLAYKLANDGNDVTLVEKESRVGGLARSFEYNGYIFDIGPHRFHTDIPYVNAFIQEILEDDYLLIERKSGVRMFGKDFEWPLNLSSLFNMPLSVLLSVGIDLLRRGGKGEQNFEDYILNQYGKTLYKIFFEPYTRKFLKAPCSEISRDWAVTGIERAVIDKNLQVNDVYKLAKSLIYPSRRLKFIYPKSGGIGQFSESLSRKIASSGGSILLNSKVDDIVKNAADIKKVIIGGRSYECDFLIWTGPVNEVLSLLGFEKVGLEYLSLLLFNYEVDHPPLLDYQWCYYGSKEIPFNRVSIPCLFNPRMAPPGRSGICAEVTCEKDEEIFENPMKLEPEIRRSLKDVGVLRDERDVLDCHIERIFNAYPVYKIDYPERQRLALDMVGQFKNLKLLGRTGTFWYNNMDHSINAALNLYTETFKAL